MTCTSTEYSGAPALGKFWCHFRMFFEPPLHTTLSDFGTLARHLSIDTSIQLYSEPSAQKLTLGSPFSPSSLVRAVDGTQVRTLRFDFRVRGRVHNYLHCFGLDVGAGVLLQGVGTQYDRLFGLLRARRQHLRRQRSVDHRWIGTQQHFK